MKPDYKNWVPKGMCLSFWIGTIIALILFLEFGVFSIGASGTLHTVLFWAFLILSLIAMVVSVYMQCLYNAFDNNGKRKLSNLCK